MTFKSELKNVIVNGKKFPVTNGDYQSAAEEALKGVDKTDKTWVVSNVTVWDIVAVRSEKFPDTYAGVTLESTVEGLPVRVAIKYPRGTLELMSIEDAEKKYPLLATQ